MNKIVFISIFLSFPVLLTAQAIEVPSEYITNKLIGNNSKLNNVEGGCILTEYSYSKIYLDGEEFDINLRLNTKNSLFEIEGKNEMIAPNENMKIYYNNEVYNYLKIDGNDFAVINLIDLNGYKLSKKYFCKYTEPIEAKSSYSTSKPGKYNIITQYMIAENDQFYFFKNNKSEIKSLLNQLFPTISGNTKKNKLKFKNESELIIFFENVFK